MTDFRKLEKIAGHEALEAEQTNPCDFRQPFDYLADQWRTIEGLAANHNYDIFAAYEDHPETVGPLIRNFCQGLYFLDGVRDSDPSTFPPRHLQPYALEDREALEEAAKHYGDSWKRRGGVGAFMMAARKWDRISNQVGKFSGSLVAALREDDRDEGIIDDLRDLRRYFLLIIEEAPRQEGQFSWGGPETPPHTI